MHNTFLELGFFREFLLLSCYPFQNDLKSILKFIYLLKEIVKHFLYLIFLYLFQGKLHDYHNILEWLMEKSNVLPRLNSRVLSPPVKTLDFTVNIGKDYKYMMCSIALFDSPDG